MPNIIDAEFTSVWDDGIAITTMCKVNKETKEVFDIISAEGGIEDSVDILIKEYVTINGQDFPVEKDDDSPDLSGGYWYRG